MVDLPLFDERRVEQIPLDELRAAIERFARCNTAQQLREGQEVLSEEIVEHDLSGPPKDDMRPSLPLYRITGYKLGWDFDPPNRSFADWDLFQAISEAMDEHEEIFGETSHFKLFGKPRSQQEERRFWSRLSDGRQPRRMSPLFYFHCHELDISFQLYADLVYTGYEAEDIAYGKVDASCT